MNRQHIIEWLLALQLVQALMQVGGAWLETTLLSLMQGNPTALALMQGFVAGADVGWKRRRKR